MVKYLFVIFYLCGVMFLNLGHQLAKGETCGDGRYGDARYMNANIRPSDLWWARIIVP